jgi:alpha-1,3-glucosyltransferase
MRWTVLSSDAWIFFPAAFAFVAIYYAGREFSEFSWTLMMIMLQPALILIDHGHFQVIHIRFQSNSF